ncbi:hypothetical protein [Streptomyces palmae]|uniref:Uncharacterized protein n=1 Tax=Streptomyces palmae TaxID=1701085 RepID=A0A4Z0HCR2_9ACTN|nr:hypothetical protein [Streptomyces palmae]TGB17699.1 hypothetical protein E4099_03125 [Streptomyces palmae]
MNEGLGSVRLTADWAVLGKHPGQAMGYDVLDGSLPADRAKRYLWGATTGVPDNRDPAEGLPWRVFLGSVSTDPTPVCAAVETTWDGSADGTGAPSYTWRLLLLEWPQASNAQLTWSAIDQVLPRDRLPDSGTGVSLAVPRTPAAELAATVDRLGFDWAARVAALLLDHRQVAIVTPPGAALPEVAERVRVLDAVCSLLPYGCRAWLSAATWTGHSEHGLRLVFAATARTGQLEVRLGAGSLPEPQGAAARTYLDELLRLRAKRHSTTDLVAHLLAAVAVIPAHGAAEAVRVLREADLLDSVIAEIGHGRGELHDVQRVLELYPAHALGENRLRVLVPFLAQRANRGSLLAQAVLQQHWSPLTPGLLARDVVQRGSTQESFARARGYLSLMNALNADRPGAFEELFTDLVGDPSQDPGWTGNLIYMVENEFGHRSEAADAFLLRSPAAGLAWLRTLAKNQTPDLAPLRRLAERGIGGDAGGTAGWPRFAAVLVGIATPDQATAEDAAEFTAAMDDAWRFALDIAATEGRPEVLGLLGPELREVARGRAGRTYLLHLLDRLVPPAAGGTAPEVAADADLLYALIAAAPGEVRMPLALPRLRRITGAWEQDAYASALVDRIGPDDQLLRLVVEALLGEVPNADSWRVLSRLMERRPTAEHLVCDGLERRLTHNHRTWLDLDFPEELMAALERRRHLDWLRPLRDFRNAVRAREPIEDLARIIVRATTSASRGFPPQLLAEISVWLRAYGASEGYALKTALDAVVPGLGLELYTAVSRGEEGRALRDQLARFSRLEVDRHQRILAALGAVPQALPQAQPSPRPLPAAQPPLPAPQPASPNPQPPPAPQPPAGTLPPVAPPQHAERKKGLLRKLLPDRPDWYRGTRE